MKPAVLTVVTLGVHDLARARAFYLDGLGWRPAPGSSDDIVFFSAGGVIVALYPRELLAKDACLPAEGTGFSGVSLAQNVASPQEVDAALARSLASGGKLLKPAQRVFWGGYSGYFADPDGHVWEVAHNPHWQLSADGQVELSG
jgi:catechol 2,3-dioxygenase-like lactoylglutathione lyase family enzyme